MKNRNMGFSHVARPQVEMKHIYSFSLTPEDFKIYNNTAANKLLEVGDICHPNTARVRNMARNSIVKVHTYPQIAEWIDGISYDPVERLYRIRYLTNHNGRVETDSRRHFPTMISRSSVELNQLFPDQTLLTFSRTLDCPLSENERSGVIQTYTELNDQSKALNYINNIYNHLTTESTHELTLLKLDCWTRTISCEQHAGRPSAVIDDAFSIENTCERVDISKLIKSQYNPSEPHMSRYFAGAQHDHTINKNSFIWRFKQKYKAILPDTEIDVSSISAYLHSPRIADTNFENIYHINAKRNISKYTRIRNILRDAQTTIDYGNVLAIRLRNQFFNGIPQIDVVDALITKSKTDYTYSQYITSDWGVLDVDLPMIAKQHVKYKGFLISSLTYQQEQLDDANGGRCVSTAQVVDFVKELQTQTYIGKNLMQFKNITSEDVAKSDASYGISTLPESMLKELYVPNPDVDCYPLTFTLGCAHISASTVAPYSIVCFTPLYVV